MITCNRTDVSVVSHMKYIFNTTLGTMVSALDELILPWGREGKQLKKYFR
jgi:hypothetical protein